MKHQLTAEVFIQAAKDYCTGDMQVLAHLCDMSEYGYIHIDKVQVPVEYDLPDEFNFTQAEIDGLLAKKRAIQAEAQLKLTQIDEQIQRLQCIEHKHGQ